MQLSSLAGRVGRRAMGIRLCDRVSANGQTAQQSLINGLAAQAFCQARDHPMAGNSPRDFQQLQRPSKRRSTSRWEADSNLRGFSTKQSSRGTLVQSENGMQSLKQELAESSEKEDTISDSKKIFCEFVLQAFFNFLSVSAVAMAVANSGGDAVLQTIQVMAAHFIILPLTICAGMEVSGAHFNPVVTACFVLVGKISAKLGVGYILGQLAGGVLGAAAAFSSLPKSMQTLQHAGLQSVPPGSTVAQAFVGEMAAAFALILVLFSTNLDPRSQWGRLKPLSIPMIVCLLMWLVGPVSSMCINPARAFGPAVVTGFWENHWIWWSAPFIGGLSAAKIYHTVFLPPKFR